MAMLRGYGYDSNGGSQRLREKRMEKTFQNAMQEVRQAQQRQKQQADRKTTGTEVPQWGSGATEYDAFAVEECTSPQTEAQIRGSIFRGQTGGTSGLRIAIAREMEDPQGFPHQFASTIQDIKVVDH